MMIGQIEDNGYREEELSGEIIPESEEECTAEGARLQ